LWLEGDDLIVRHMRTRLGAAPANGEDAISIHDGNRVILDHSSASWSTDEVSSVTDNATNNTIQWSLITEPLNSQNHARSSLFRPGANVSAATPTAFNLSVHHNLYAHGSDRNPVMSTYNGHTLNIDFRNNIVFDWRNQATHTGDLGQFINVNFISNYYVTGLTTRSDLVANPIIFSSGSTDTVIHYNADNLVDATRDDGLRNPIWDATAIGGARTERAMPFNYPTVTTQTAAAAYESILSQSGAFWWNRDPVDERVTTDVREISDPNAAVRAQSGMMLTTEANAGGLPVLPIETRPADWDIDGDGMPGWWEVKHGLNPGVANHNGDFDNDLYTDVEEYVNDIGAFPAPAPIMFNGALNTRFARAENWSAKWQPSQYDDVTLPAGTTVVDSVGQHAGTLRIAPDAGQTAALNIISGWLEVADTMEIAAAGANGQLNLSGGALRAEALAKGAGGTFNFTGGSLSADRIEFDLTNNGGTISPGVSPGQTQVMGNLAINSGDLHIELGPAPGSQFDQLLITGNAALAGELNVSLINGFTLGPDALFEILDISGVRTGEFSGLAEGDLVGHFGRDLFITYEGGDGNDVALFTLSSPLGDFDHDNDVDGNDFLTWQRDPSVGDLSDWQTNFGASSSVNAASTPEPSGWIIFVSLVATVGRRAKMQPH
jgi:hypothetical protein